ncbi:MAG: hypothetical protein KDA74_21140, partial [Planctomycetaceae bacterium]|nr:hypothetical protein [Planctomycetaceae bacterium]
DETEIEERMREFVTNAKSNGYDLVLKETCDELASITDPRQQEVIKKCLDRIASADGKIEKQERDLRNRFHAIIGSKIS